ncbi:hypothetical protein M3J09_008993 [Ascochyta lentis]
MMVESRLRSRHTLTLLATHAVSSLGRRALGRSAARVNLHWKPLGWRRAAPHLVTLGASDKHAQVVAVRDGRIGRSWRDCSPRVLRSGRESVRRLTRRR